MEWTSEDNSTEQAVDVAAAAVFAAAVGFAAGAVGLGAAATISAAVAGSVVTFTVLRKIPIGNRTFDLPAFEPVPLELAPEGSGELLLDDRGSDELRFLESRCIPSACRGVARVAALVALNLIRGPSAPRFPP